MAVFWVPSQVGWQFDKSFGWAEGCLVGMFWGVARFRTLMMIGMSNLRSHQGRCPQVPRSALFSLDISLDISLDSVMTDPDR